MTVASLPNPSNQFIADHRRDSLNIAEVLGHKSLVEESRFPLSCSSVKSNKKRKESKRLRILGTMSNSECFAKLPTVPFERGKISS
jgi:hypothetical protein